MITELQVLNLPSFLYGTEMANHKLAQGSLTFWSDEKPNPLTRGFFSDICASREGTKLVPGWEMVRDHECLMIFLANFWTYLPWYPSLFVQGETFSYVEQALLKIILKGMPKWFLTESLLLA